MKFAKRMDRFGEGVFSKLAEIKKRKLEAGSLFFEKLSSDQKICIFGRHGTGR